MGDVPGVFWGSLVYSGSASLTTTFKKHLMKTKKQSYFSWCILFVVSRHSRSYFIKEVLISKKITSEKGNKDDNVVPVSQLFRLAGKVVKKQQSFTSLNASPDMH